ncbi:MAG: hypothetical protein QOJ65_1480 [Fimbriimonadaceae bacterium]|jgi:hypothetical protein|nr:hypothetical protein [Fimbriimonadaceae bacterium]
MPAEVYEDALELTVGIVEAVLPDSGQYLHTAYPYPSLRPTSRTETRVFRTVVLENSFLRAVIVPDLGGRILRLTDKRTSAEILPIEPLIPVAGGMRGVFLPQGIQVRYGTEDRLTCLGTAAFLPVPAESEKEEAGVWIGELGVGLSFNALVSIAPDAAELSIEIRTFNRTLANAPYNGGLAIYQPGAKAFASSIYDLADPFGFLTFSKARDCGLAVWCDDSELASARIEKDRLHINRFSRKTKFAMGARQLDTWRFRLTPWSALGSLPATCPDASMVVTKKLCRIQATRRLANHKLVLLTRSGETLESPVDAYPKRALEISLSGLPSPPQEVALLGPAGEQKIRHVLGSRLAPLESRRQDADRIAEQESKARVQLAKSLDIKSQPKRAALLPSFRPNAYLLLTAQSIRQDGTTLDAENHLETALLFNGEDHLAWWAKAVIRRLRNVEEEERQELLNAHYLAPLEPALRAESFLSQTQPLGKDPSPILKPLEDAPEQFVEVACLLIDLGLIQEASRWLDEAIRHEDLPMLRYLQASLLQGTRMSVDAAEHVRVASAMPLKPPFPYRAVELDALDSLQRAFPQDPRLADYLILARTFGQKLL